VSASANPIAVQTLRESSLSRILRRPLLLAAIVVVVGITAVVIAAPILSSHGPLEQDLVNAWAGPSGNHLLGTDSLGRDILARLLYGGRPTLSGVAVAVAVFVLVGMFLGVLAGYLMGLADRIVSPALDVMLSVPSVIILLAVLAVFKQNIYVAMVALGFFGSANLARMIRSACMVIREELYVDAARVSGIGPLRIMARHVLPALTGTLVVQMALFSGIALGVQTGLGFLGLGTAAPAPSWGGLVSEAAGVIQQHPSFLLISGGVIGVMTIALGLIGDGLRDLEADRRIMSGSRKLRQGPQPTDEAPVDETALLVVRDYSVAFSTADGPRTVVDHINFTVRRGEIFGLVGESGSGKTVTALSLLGLLPENGAVVSGDARLDGVRISPATEADLLLVRGHQVGLVSQEPMVALDPLYTVGSQLREVIGRIGDSKDRRQVRQRGLDLLTSVHLRDPEQVMRLYPHELSGGMAQRVVIALALAGSPRLLIADEPTTALDVTVQAGILDLLRALRDEREMAIILVTHDLGVVADICDRAIVMQKGRIVEQGSLEEIFYEAKDPYTRQLLESTPNIAGGTGV
jgi:peptide/nickel transport system permease protein